jgi:predicted amidophosphoribosyltransferase
VFSAGPHHGRLRHTIARYKYRREKALAPVLGSVLAAFVREHAAWLEEFDAITAVPSYCGPGARRDWDPVGVLVEAAAAGLPDWAVRPGLIEKRSETPAMQGLTWAHRQVVGQGPLRRSLAVPNAELVSGTRLLVVDDVMTGGSTLREVARCLRAAGAREVAGLVLARPIWTEN